MNVITKKNTDTVGKTEVTDFISADSENIFDQTPKILKPPLPFSGSRIDEDSSSHEFLKMNFQKRPFPLVNVIKTWFLVLKIKESYYM